MSRDEPAAYAHEQAQRMRKLWASVVPAVLDEAVNEQRATGIGTARIAAWARSANGREVLSMAGFPPGERVTQGLVEFVKNGVRTNKALARERKLECSNQ